MKKKEKKIEQTEEVVAVETQNEPVVVEETVGEVVAKNDAPAKHLLMMNFQRFGEIFSNVSTALAVVAGFALLGMFIAPFAMMLNWIIAIGLVIISLGTILFASNMSFDSLIWIRPENISAFGEFLFNVLPYVLGVAFATSVLAVVFLFLNKRKRPVGRIVLGIIIALVALVGVIIVSLQ